MKYSYKSTDDYLICEILRSDNLVNIYSKEDLSLYHIMQEYYKMSPMDKQSFSRIATKLFMERIKQYEDISLFFLGEEGFENGKKRFLLRSCDMKAVQQMNFNTFCSLLFREISYSSPLSEVVSNIQDMVHNWVKSRTAWDDIDRYEEIYRPFMLKLRDVLSTIDSQFFLMLLDALYDKHDYYALITDSDNKAATMVAHNLFGNINAPRIPIPSRILRLDLRAYTTLKITMDNDWEFAFRIFTSGIIVKPNSIRMNVSVRNSPKTYTERLI